MIIKHKLTKKILEEAKPNSILFKGEIVDGPKGFNINNTGKIIKYVVVRREVFDWCIYVESSYNDMTFSQVRSVGDKIFRSTAKVIIDAPKKVWDMWAF